MENEEVDFYTADLQWVRARLIDSRTQITEAYDLTKNSPAARERLANTIGTIDTIVDRITRLVPSGDPTQPTNYVRDIKPPSKSKPKKFMDLLKGV